MLSTHFGKLAAVAGAALIAVTSGPETTSSRAPVDDPVDYKKEIEPLLQKHCFKCHGDRKQKGDMQLNVLDPQMGTRADAEGWHAALDVINAGEMPPEDEEQFSDEERRKVVAWLTESLAAAADKAERLDREEQKRDAQIAEVGEILENADRHAPDRERDEQDGHDREREAQPLAAAPGGERHAEEWERSVRVREGVGRRALGEVDVL